MSPTSYQTAPPRTSMVAYRADAVNFSDRISWLVLNGYRRYPYSVDLMATTQARSAPAPGLPYYVWEVPGKPISIQLSFDAIDRLCPEIMRGLGALKRRGAEVGGILLGRLAPDSPGKVLIEDFEPVPSEYLTGPSYNLSANDRVRFEAAIARHKSQEAAGLTVVGFYRSHTRDELYIDDADMALAQQYFPDAANVFLLIKPFASRTSIGGFFFW